MMDAASWGVLSRFVFEHSREPLIVLDGAGRVLEANRAASADPDLTEPFRRREREPEVRAFLQRLSGTGQAHLDLATIRFDGAEPGLQLRGVALDGSFVLTLERSRRVVALEAELRQLRRVETLGLLTARIVHDVNNLLVPLLVLSHDLVAQLEGLELDASAAHDIEATAQRASSLLKSVLDYARPRPARTECVTLNAAVFGIRPLLELLIAPDVKLVLTLDGRPLHVDVDRVQLEQSLLNLVSNANQAMSKGGELRIVTRPAGLGQEGGAGLSGPTHAVLIVSDTGAGMSREVQQRAFEPFFTTRSAGGGTGLGLSCVKQFVHDNRGFIELESEPGRGTSISLHLPLAAAPGRASTAPEHGPSCPPNGAV